MRESASLSQKAYEALRRDIIICAFPPGEQITQSQLTSKYGIGLTPIREAMQRLVQERYLSAVGSVGLSELRRQTASCPSAKSERAACRSGRPKPRTRGAETLAPSASTSRVPSASMPSKACSVPAGA